MEKKTGLELLREPFKENQISQLPKGTKAQNECPSSEKKNCEICGGWHHPKIKHLAYVGHAALTDRLLDADPLWTWEPFSITDEGLPAFDKTGGLWICLTVCGHSMIGYGHAAESQYKEIGSREKEVIGDALRNAAMRLGAALDLWHKGDLHEVAQEGLMEGTKKEPAKTTAKKPEAKKDEPPWEWKPGSPKAKINTIRAIYSHFGWTEKGIKDAMVEYFKKDSSKDLTDKEVDNWLLEAQGFAKKESAIIAKEDILAPDDEMFNPTEEELEGL